MAFTKYNTKEVKIIVNFLRFLMRFHLEERTINAIKQRHGRCFKLEKELLHSPANIFDHGISWNYAYLGWNYWANVSYRWKTICKQRRLTKCVNDFEIQCSSFQLLTDEELKQS